MNAQQMKRNIIWALSTGTIATIAIVMLAAEFSKYGVL